MTTRSEQKRIEALVRKTQRKVELQKQNQMKEKNSNGSEKRMVDAALQASDAHKLFKEAKEND